MEKRIIKKVFIFILFFILFLIVFACFWIGQNFYIQHLGQILFHLNYPLLNIIGDDLPKSFIQFCFPPAFLLALLFCILFKKTKSIVYSFLILLLGTVYVMNHYLKISDFIKNQMDFSNLYELHYQSPPSFENLNLEKKRNLVVIFVESLSSAFSAESGEAVLGEITPQLGKMAKEGIAFSYNDKAAGIHQMMGTGWTTAGIVGYLCGVPLNLPFNAYRKEEFIEHYFLNSALCVPDILKKHGYHNVRISGIVEQFGGLELFFKMHQSEVKDLKFYQNHGVLPQSLDDSTSGSANLVYALDNKTILHKEKWGMNDRTLFELALKEFEHLNKQNQAFALYISTMDTHPPFGFVDPKFCQDFKPQFLNSFQCSERVVLDFVNKIKKTDPDVSVILLGDHLPMDLDKLQNKGIYNLFVDPAFAKEVSTKQLKNRQLTHFDMAPLILESVGIPTDFLGLGKNPLRDESLLEKMGKEKFNQELVRRNHFYENLWKNPKEQKE